MDLELLVAWPRDDLDLFKGPLSDLVIKALVALSGLNRLAMSGQM